MRIIHVYDKKSGNNVTQTLIFLADLMLWAMFQLGTGNKLVFTCPQSLNMDVNVCEENVQTALRNQSYKPKFSKPYYNDWSRNALGFEPCLEQMLDNLVYASEFYLSLAQHLFSCLHFLFIWSHFHTIIRPYWRLMAAVVIHVKVWIGNYWKLSGRKFN